MGGREIAHEVTEDVVVGGEGWAANRWASAYGAIAKRRRRKQAWGMLPGRRSPHDYLGTVLGAPDPRGLARFYAEVLDWQLHSDEEGWATIAPAQAHVYLGFQLEEGHVPPVWPAGSGDQQMQMHLDIEVTDLDAAVAAAVRLGGTVAAHQPQDEVRVIIDPAGHPFCLYVSLPEEDDWGEGGHAARISSRRHPRVEFHVVAPVAPPPVAPLVRVAEWQTR